MGQSLCKGFILENDLTLKATGGAVCTAPKECGIGLCTSHLHQDQGSQIQKYKVLLLGGKRASAAGVCGLTGVPGRGSSFFIFAQSRLFFSSECDGEGAVDKRGGKLDKKTWFLIPLLF